MQLLAALALCTYTGKIVCTNSCQECGHKRLCIMLCTYIPNVPTYSEAGNPPLLSLSSTETTIKTISTAVKTIYATYSCLCIFLYSPEGQSQCHSLEMVSLVWGQLLIFFLLSSFSQRTGQFIASNVLRLSKAKGNEIKLSQISLILATC